MLDFRVFKFKFTIYGTYFNNEPNSSRLVFDVFEDGLSWIEALKDTLERSDMDGLTGEYVRVHKYGGNVEIAFAGWVDEEDLLSVIVNKKSLLAGINTWIELVKIGTPEIAIFYDETGSIGVFDRRSILELCNIDINMKPVAKKEYDFVLLNRNFYVHGDMRSLDNDLYLSMLSQIFTPHQEWTHMVEQALRDSDTKGVSYQDNSIIIEDQKVIIQSTRYCKPEEYVITIEKNELISLIERWNELVAKNIKDIVIKRYPGQKIVMEEYITK